MNATPDIATPPPHSVRDEAGALACVLIAVEGGELERAAAMLEQLEASHFYDIRHRAAFSVLRKAGPCTTPDLVERLQAGGKLEGAGGLEYVARLPDAAPSAASFPDCLATLTEQRSRRAMLDIAGRAAALARDGAGFTPAGLADLAEFVQTIAAQAAPTPELQPICLTTQPPPLQVVYELAGRPVCTAGNLTAVVAPPKSAKSAFIGAMLAAPMVPGGGEADCLGLASRNPAGKALLHFDTEQAPTEHWHLLARAVRRAGTTSAPPWLLSYSLAGLSASEAWRAVRDTVKRQAGRFGGVHAVLIDGVADLVADVNDGAECNRLVAELHALAIDFECPVVNVLHLNPGTEKSRGHLGSQLERKAESNLRLERDGEAVSLVADKQRRAPIPKGEVQFSWSDEKQMHASLPAGTPTRKESAKARRLVDERDLAFGEKTALTYKEIVGRLVEDCGLSRRTAERRFGEFKEAGLLKNPAGNLWERAA